MYMNAPMLYSACRGQKSVLDTLEIDQLSAATWELGFEPILLQEQLLVLIAEPSL